MFGFKYNLFDNLPPSMYNFVFDHNDIYRIIPDTDFAGYQANNFAGYRISG